MCVAISFRLVPILVNFYTEDTSLVGEEVLIEGSRSPFTATGLRSFSVRTD